MDQNHSTRCTKYSYQYVDWTLVENKTLKVLSTLTSQHTALESDNTLTGPCVASGMGSFGTGYTLFFRDGEQLIAWA